MSNLSHNLIQLYAGILPIIFIPATMLGVFTGINTSDSTKTPIHNYVNIIGFSGIGMITGLTFPISVPLLSGYVMYQHIRYNVEKDK